MDAKAYLGESKIFVGIFNDGRHSIAIECKEGWLFQLGSRVDFCRVGHVKVGEVDGDLPRIGSGWDQLATPKLTKNLSVNNH